VAELGRQFQALEGVVKVATNVPAAATAAMGETSKRLTELRRRLGVPAPGQQGGGGGGGGFGGGPNPNVRAVIGQTKGQVMNSTSLPTAQQVRVSTESREDLVKVVQEANALIAEFPALYDKLGVSGLKPAALKPIRVVGTTSTQ
jgi:hypothetical protein